jgi:hypothetical protein
MPISIDEFRKATSLKSADRLTSMAGALQALAQEAVRMEAVTGSAEWNHFLAYIEAAAKDARAKRDYEIQRLRDPMMVDAKEMATSKAKLAVLDGRINALDEVIGLPKFIQENARLAAATIDEMTKNAA